MLRIWKLDIAPGNAPNENTTRFPIEMPEHARILSLHERHGYIAVSILANPLNKIVHRHFSIHSARNEIRNLDVLTMPFIGKLNMNNGQS